MNCGRAEALSSSRRRFPSTARFAVTSAILTVTSSKSDRAPIRSTADAGIRLTPGSTVDARPGCFTYCGLPEGRRMRLVQTLVDSDKENAEAALPPELREMYDGDLRFR